MAWVYPTSVRLMPSHFFIETENEKDDLFLSENVLFKKREHAEWRERERGFKKPIVALTISVCCLTLRGKENLM